MPKKLVIVESPAKAKTIGRIVGSDYIVKSSVGHIRDLPQKSLGVDIDKGFEPTYVMMPSKKKVVEELRKAARDSDVIYLASDPDREGEAIAWHLKELLISGNRKKDFLRIQYNEITPRAVKAAFDNPGELDMKRVEAQQARRILDRIVGYKISPVLWRRVQKGLSAGRVQSVALRLICEREAEIQEFVPQAYWVFAASVRKMVDPRDAFTAKLTRINGQKAEILTEEKADAIRSELAGASLSVHTVNTRTVSRNPYPPFITSTLQQSASGALRMSPGRTMSLAQKLYEGVELGSEGPVGLITYMRTDSVSVSAEARDAARDYIVKRFGKEYCPERPNVYRSRGSAQEAHEAIRPTDVNRTPQSLASVLNAAELKLYTLIWKRFLASQMSAARIEQRTALVDAFPAGAEQNAAQGGQAPYQLSATASEILFPGHLKVTEEDTADDKEEREDKDDDSSDTVASLPPLENGEKLDALKWMDERKETKPPPRFTEASLIKALEANGVGRPSTYASILETIAQRDYATREKRLLTPTELGQRTNEVLVSTFPTLFDVGFTAAMENELDQIEDGEDNWKGMLLRFYSQFRQWMKDARAPEADTSVVTEALEMLSQVRQWAPETKRGRRTFSDEKFVTSLREQFTTENSPPITDRQLEALLKIICRYRAQLSSAESFLEKINRADLLEAPELQPPRESTIKKLELLAKLELPENSASFVASLAGQVESGRRLSDAQIRALDGILASLMGVSAQVTKETLDQFGINPSDGIDSGEAREMIDALRTVTEWRPPSKRGKRVYDDADFVQSVTSQFEGRGTLSPAQFKAIKNIVARYHAQIKNYAELVEKYGLPKDGMKVRVFKSGQGGSRKTKAEDAAPAE